MARNNRNTGPLRLDNVLNPEPQNGADSFAFSGEKDVAPPPMREVAPEPVEELAPAIKYVTIQIPVMAPPMVDGEAGTYFSPRLDIVYDTAQAEAMRHVACALDFDRNLRLNSGEGIRHHPDVTRFIIDQLVSALPQCMKLVRVSESRKLFD